MLIQSEPNTTGVVNFNTTLEAKRLGLLHELTPQAASIGVFVNPNYPPAASQLRGAVEEAARTVGLGTLAMRASNDGEIEAAFESAIRHRRRHQRSVFQYQKRDAGGAGDPICCAHRVSLSGNTSRPEA